MKHRVPWFQLLVVMALVLSALPLGAALAQDSTSKQAEVPAGGEVIAEGLNGPMGVLVDPNGDIWAIDSGTGGEEPLQVVNPETGELVEGTLGNTARIVKISAADGTLTDVATVASVGTEAGASGGNRLALVDGTLYATVGDWESTPDVDAPPGMATLVKVNEDGTTTEIAQFWPRERDENPDGIETYHAHPYGLIGGPDGLIWVAEAGGNNLATVDPATGEISTVAVFDPLPGVFPRPEYGDEMLTDPVPTAVTIGSDGETYVSLLSGAPFVPGSAKVMKVGADGTTSDYATGLTMLTDLRTGPDGNLYAVSFGVFGEQGPVPASGGIWRIGEGDQSELLIGGLSFATSLDFNADGDAFVTINGLGAPGSGQVVKFAGATAMAGTPLSEVMAAMAPPPAAGAPEATAAMTETMVMTETVAAPVEEAPEPVSILDTAAAAGSFNTLAEAVKAAGLSLTLKGGGPFTVFAPTDDAFAAVPQETLDALLADPAALRKVLLYHVVSGKVASTDLTDGMTAKTAAGEDVVFTVGPDGVMVNTANVVTPDVAASNGIIHVIDSVLIPPSMGGETGDAGAASDAAATTAAVEGAAPMAEVPEGGEVIAEGLNGPMGVLVDPNGDIWAIDSGMGGDEPLQVFNPEAGGIVDATLGNTARIVKISAADGTLTDVATLPSLGFEGGASGGNRLALVDGTLYATVGEWQSTPDVDPPPGLSTLVKVNEDGTTTEVAQFWPYERDVNPDGRVAEPYHSHPFGVIGGPDGLIWIADAGANALETVDPATGEISTVAVFDPLPGVFPRPAYDNEMLTDPVPTAVTIGSDGETYVSLLSGAPFVPGSAKVMQVGADGTTSDYATGLTMLIDLRTGPDGNLYAVSFGVFGEQGPVPNSGGVWRIGEDDQSELVIGGLSFPTSVDFNADGDAFVTINGVGAPGSGQVVKFAGASAMPGTPLSEVMAAMAPPAAAGAPEATAAMTETMTTTETGAAPAGAETTQATAGTEAPAPETMPVTGGESDGRLLALAIGAVLLALGGVAFATRRRTA